MDFIFEKLNFFLFICVDKEHLLVHAEPIVSGVLNSSLVIPCKPTSKDVKVELTKDFEEVCLIEKKIT